MMMVNARLRPGNTADLSSYKPFMQQTFEWVLVNHKIGLVQADSGFYSDGLHAPL